MGRQRLLCGRGNVHEITLLLSDDACSIQPSWRSLEWCAHGTMPVSLDLAAFRYASIDYAWLRKSDGSQVHALVALTSLDLVVAAAVPEPGSAALMCLGLLVIGIAGTYRKPARRAA